MIKAIIPKTNSKQQEAPTRVLFLLSKYSSWVAGIHADTLAPNRKMNYIAGTLAAR